MIVPMAMPVAVMVMPVAVPVMRAMALGGSLGREHRVDGCYGRQGEPRGDHAAQERPPVGVVRQEIALMLVHGAKLPGRRAGG